MRRIAVCSLLVASLVGCAGAAPSSSPAASSAAITTPVAVLTPPPSASTVPSPTASPSALPTLTPRSTPAQGRGTWTTVKGSALVEPTAVAVPAGDRGVLLLDMWAGGGGCETPERNASGTPASFYDSGTHAITRVSGDVQLHTFAVASLADGRVMVAGGYNVKDASGPTRRTRIWDPRTRKWAEGAPMTIARAYPFLVTLADGRVMAAGGGDDVGCPECVELYDPAKNRWTPTSR